MPRSLLQGDRIRLTAIDVEDLVDVAGWYQDNEFLRLLDARPAFPRSAAMLSDWLYERNRATDGFLFGIRELDTSNLIGFVELEGILWPHQSGWVGLAIGDAAHRGRGYGYNAMRLATEFAFAELNLHRLQLTVFAYNQPAIRLYERLGFTLEGCYREFLQRDGTRFDMLLYGLLRPEWEATRTGTA